jgi:hypothetical protein
MRNILQDLLVASPLLLGRALSVLSTNWVSTNFVRHIDPARVLAEPWSPGRLTQCRKLLAAGELAPAITVVGWRLGRHVFYGVTDGMHRTVAHREAGLKVKARITGYGEAQPAAHVLWDDILWQQRGERLRRVSYYLPEELQRILLVLGVRGIRRGNGEFDEALSRD